MINTEACLSSNQHFKSLSNRLLVFGRTSQQKNTQPVLWETADHIPCSVYTSSKSVMVSSGRHRTLSLSSRSLASPLSDTLSFHLISLSSFSRPPPPSLFLSPASFLFACRPYTSWTSHPLFCSLVWSLPDSGLQDWWFTFTLLACTRSRHIPN